MDPMGGDPLGGDPWEPKGLPFTVRLCWERKVALEEKKTRLMCLKSSLVDKETLEFYKKYFIYFVKNGFDDMKLLKKKERIQY